LPRQARDKHEEKQNIEKGGVSFCFAHTQRSRRAV
jgi:hypothetical protein